VIATVSPASTRSINALTCALVSARLIVFTIAS
jgi:hypothetical protein